MTLLVTGGAGFIGANLVRRRRAHRPEQPIVVLDALTYAGSRDSLAGVPSVTFVHGDVCDGDLVARLLAEHRVEAIAHLAAETHVDRSIVAPDAFLRTNIVGTGTLLRAAREAGVTRFVHVSTDEVYGELAPGAPPWREDAALSPRSPYAASKAAADHLVAAWRETYGYPAMITRCTNNYGPYQLPEKLVPLALSRALEGAPVPVYGDGKQRRDWLHVDDHCDALERVLDHGEPGRVYHVAAGDERANIDVVRAVLRAAGAPSDAYEHVPDRLGHDRRYALDTSRIEAELGWAPRRRLDEGLAETVAWYRAHPSWWQRARRRAERSP